MKKWGDLKPIRLAENEFKTNFRKLREDDTVFVGSSCDIFANDIEYDWIKRILEFCSNYYIPYYLFQTKNPARMLSFIPYFPVKSLICTTIESNRFYPEFMGTTPKPVERSGAMNIISNYFHTYVTIEPIMDFDLQDMIALISHCHPRQVNIGADSGNNGLKEPQKGKIMDLISELKKFTIIDKKKNLTRLLK